MFLFPNGIAGRLWVKFKHHYGKKNNVIASHFYKNFVLLLHMICLFCVLLLLLMSSLRWPHAAYGKPNSGTAVLVLCTALITLNIQVGKFLHVCNGFCLGCANILPLLGC